MTDASGSFLDTTVGWPCKNEAVSMDLVMNVADADRCLTLLTEADRILIANGEGLLAAHLSTVIELMHGVAKAAVDSGC